MVKFENLVLSIFRNENSTLEINVSHSGVLHWQQWQPLASAPGFWRLFYGCKQFNSNIGCTDSEASWTGPISSRNKLGIPPHCRFSTLLRYWALTKDLKHSFLSSKKCWLGLYIILYNYNVTFQTLWKSDKILPSYKVPPSNIYCPASSLEIVNIFINKI